MDRRKATYKLYPTAMEAAALDVLLRHHQQLYNAALQERRDAWDKQHVSISYEDQCASLTALRQSDPAWVIANCSSEQVTLRRVKKAYDAFFRRYKAGETPGYPRFKSKDRMPGFGFKSHGDGWRFTPGSDWKHGTLRLQGIGTMQARGQPRQGGTIKSCELMHKRGVWHLSLTLECPTIERDSGNAACGLDWGVETFAMLALPDGSYEPIENPRLYRTQKAKELELERIRDRRKRRSNRRRRASIRCGKLKARNARRRKDFHHQTSAKLVRRFALIGTEQLQVSNMTRSAKGTVEKPGKNVAQKAGLNREILDTGPAAFFTMMRTKAEEAGALFMEAPTRKLKPSQRCPACDAVQAKSLSERMHICPCGHTEPRDAASARVCLNWAMHELQRPGTDSRAD
jgi:putative transposase